MEQSDPIRPPPRPSADWDKTVSCPKNKEQTEGHFTDNVQDIVFLGIIREIEGHLRLDNWKTLNVRSFPMVLPIALWVYLSVSLSFPQPRTSRQSFQDVVLTLKF